MFNIFVRVKRRKIAREELVLSTYFVCCSQYYSQTGLITLHLSGISAVEACFGSRHSQYTLKIQRPLIIMENFA